MSEKAYVILVSQYTAPEVQVVTLLAPVTGTLDRVFMSADTGPVGGNAVFDVNVNGVSIWLADQTQRPKILSGDTTVDKTDIAAAVTQYTDEVTVDFDGFTGSATSVGGKLVVILEFTETGVSVGADSGAVVHRVGSLSINSNPIVPQQVLFDDNGGVEQDDGGYFSLSDACFKIPADGWYTVTAQVRWESGITGSIYSMFLLNSGSTPIAIDAQVVPTFPGPGSHEPAQRVRQRLTRSQFFVTNDLVDLRVYQNSGGAKNVEATNSETWMAITPAARV